MSVWDALNELDGKPAAPTSGAADLFSKLGDMRQATATGNLLQAQDGNPDQAARADFLSKELGIPQPVVEKDLPGFEAQYQLKQNRATMAGNQGLQNFAADNPLAVRMAQDDFDHLNYLSQAWTALKAGYNMADIHSQLANIYTRQAVGMQQPGDEEQATDLQNQMAAIPQYSGGIGWTGRQIGGLAPIIGTSVKGGLVGAGVGAAAGSVLPGPGTIAGAVSGFGTGFSMTFAEEFGREGFADLYHEIGQMKDGAGNPVPESVRLFSSIAGGTLMGAVASVGQGWVAQSLGNGAKKLFLDALNDAVTKPTIMRALGNFTTEMAKSGLEGAAFNSMTTLAQTFGEQTARWLTPGLSTIASDPAQWEDFKTKMISGIEDGLMLFPLLHLPGAVMGLAGETLRAKQAEYDANALQAFADGIPQSKLQQRSIDTFIDWMKSQTEGTPLETIQVKARALMELYQKAGVDPFKLDPKDDPLLGWLPDRDEQLRDGIAKDADVVLPTSEFLSRLGGTPAFNELLQDVRVRQDGYTLREATDLPAMQARLADVLNQVVNLKGNYDHELAAEEPTQRVFNDTMDQLKAAGVPEKEALAYAQVHSARMAIRSSMLPESYPTAWEAYQKNPLKIQAGERPGLFQKQPEGPRASLQLPEKGYGTGPTVMNLFAARDRSSFLHEASHLYLEEMLHDAQLPDAPEQLKGDLQAVKDWFATHADQARQEIMSRWSQDIMSRWNAAVKKAGDNPSDLNAQAQANALREAARLLEADPKYMETFAQTLGAGMDPATRTALIRPYHELFARHGEAYFMEGKAPSPGLQGAFDSFRRWLIQVYEKVSGKGRQWAGLSNAGGTPIDMTPEIRGVMDRLFATDEQINLVRQQQRLQRLFNNAKDSGLTAAEFKVYNNLIAKGLSESKAKLQAKAMAQLEKEKSDEWKARDKEIRPGIEEQINNRPDIQALTYLRTGKLADGSEGPRVRLDNKAVERLIGKDGIDKMPPGSVAAKAGLDPQQLAEMLGMGSGDELVRSLLSLEAQRRQLPITGTQDIRQHLIDTAVHADNQNHFGDMMVDGSMPSEAMDAVHTDASGQALAMELTALIRQSGKPGARFGPVADARAAAANMLDNTKVGQIATRAGLNRLARDEQRAAINCELAMQKGKLEEAIGYKRTQILNHALYTEAVKASKVLDKFLDNAKYFGSKQMIKSMDQDALDQIHTLLERFGLKQPTQDATSRMVLTEWLRRQESLGADVYCPDTVFDPTLPGDYRALTVQQFRDISDAVKSIAHVGREAQKVTNRGKQVEFETAVGSLITSAIANNRVRSTPLERNPGVVQGDIKQRTATRWTNAKGLLPGFGSALRRMEGIVDQLDGGDAQGPWNSYIFRRAAEGEAYKSKWLTTMTAGLKSLNTLYTKDERADMSFYLPDIDELTDSRTQAPLRITKAELVALALNRGNDSNWSKLLRGEQWKEPDVIGVLDRYMGKNDWDYVQGVWDLLAQLRPEIAAREKRMTGVEPPWVAERPFSTPHGDYRGGYYPMAYDPARSGDAMDRMLESVDRLMDAGRAGRPNTDKGYTMARKEGYAKGILFSLDVIPRHIESVVTDLAFREFVYDSVRLLSNEGVRDTVQRTAGQNAYGEFIPWIKRTINDRTYDPKNMSGWDNFFHGVRTHATMVGLGYRFSTMMMHGIGAGLNSIGEVGPKWMAIGAARFFGTFDKMAEARDFVYARSDEMAHRMETVDRDIRDALRDLAGKNGGIVSGAKRFAYMGISMLDMGSALPTWLGAYEKAMAPTTRGGLGLDSEADAIYYANKAVRNAHGGGGSKDMARIQDGSETFKLLTMFYSFWNHSFNRQLAIVQDAAKAARTIASGEISRGTVDFGHVLARSFFYFVTPMIIHGLFKSGGPEEDEGWAYWAMKEIGLGLFSGIPVARDVATALSTGKDYKPTPALALWDAAMHTKKDFNAWQQDEPVDFVDSKWLKHTMDTAGYTFGLPIGGQAGATAQYIWDVMSGDERPEDTSDFLKGIVFGPPRKK